MSAVVLTLSIARAAAQDAGNRHMKAAGRTEWNDDDWNIAAAVLADLAKQMPTRSFYS